MKQFDNIWTDSTLSQVEVEVTGWQSKKYVNDSSYIVDVLCQVYYTYELWTESTMMYNVNVNECHTQVFLAGLELPAMEFKTSLENDVSTEVACFMDVWVWNPPLVLRSSLEPCIQSGEEETNEN